MSSPEDRAVRLLQRTSELMLECRAVAQSATGAGEQHRVSSGGCGADCIRRTGGCLGGRTRHHGTTAIDVLKRFSSPAGPLGEQWLGEQEKKLGEHG